MRNVPIRFVSVSAGVLAAIVVSATPARAADGDLDPTFGTGGKVISSLGFPGQFGTAMALYPGNRIVVVGHTFDNQAHSDFGVVRYNPDGTPDATFGSGGAVAQHHACGRAPHQSHCGGQRAPRVDAAGQNRGELV